jgi:ribosome-associated heat shock protein Hsp15
MSHNPNKQPILTDTDAEQRLDKWLHVSCLFKTRSQATKACEQRRIKVNGETAKPAKTIKPGDELTIRYPNGQYVNFDILGVAHKNLPKKLARDLYNMHTQELSDKDIELLQLLKQTSPTRPKYKGRPTKKERRELNKVHNKYRSD